MTLQERIIKSRKQIELNQTQLAKLAGTTAPTISQYESGKRTPSSKALFQLAKALNVTPDYLLYGQQTDEIILSEEDKEFFILLKSLNHKDKKSVKDFLKFMAANK